MLDLAGSTRSLASQSPSDVPQSHPGIAQPLFIVAVPDYLRGSSAPAPMENDPLSSPDAEWEEPSEDGDPMFGM
jgi:hypothetical protein